MIRCENCGYQGEDYIRDLGIILCPTCKSMDIEDLTPCVRCGAYTDSRLCPDCKEEIDKILSDAIAEIENAPNSDIDYILARDLLIERVEELE